MSAELRLEGEALSAAISAAMVHLCVLEDILTTAESRLVEFGSSQEVLAGRIAQTDTEDEFTAAIENLTQRRVVAFLSANQTTPACACELFFLDPGDKPGLPPTRARV